MCLLRNNILGKSLDGYRFTSVSGHPSGASDIQSII